MIPKLHFDLKDRPLLFMLAVGFILIMIIVTIAYSILTGKPKASDSIITTPTPTSQQGSSSQADIQIDKVIPDEPAMLDSEKPATFFVYFHSKTNPSNVDFNLSYIDLTQDNPPKIVKLQVNSSAGNVVQLTTGEPILQQADYTLTITDRQSNKTLFSGIYPSRDIPPTPVPTNNSLLKRYLPYDTSTYTLVYVPEKNLYVSHLKWNPDLPDTYDVQFQSAKTDALNFIQSKGIDISTVVIEWRRY